MTLTIPDQIAEQAGIDEASAMKELVCSLLIHKKITMGQARRMAGIDRWTLSEWMKELKIEHDYDVEDFRQDMQTLKELGVL